MLSFQTLTAGDSFPLFKTHPSHSQIALFDERGFHLSADAQLFFNAIRAKPHCYLAWSHKRAYVGRSYQQQGRWNRSKQYHLRELLHAVFGMENAHTEWALDWFNGNVLETDLGLGIELQSEVRIAFVPIEHMNALTYPEWPLDFQAPPLFKGQHSKPAVRRWLHLVEHGILDFNPEINWLNQR